MHPSRVIRGRTSQLLSGRRIVVGIAGSIAAVEVPRIVRELLRHGAEVRAVMSGEAQRILTPEAIQFATGQPPITHLTGDVEHVSLLGPGGGQADLLLIAPATANTIAKIAHGIDDTPVTSFASMALGGGVPILLAPAMHAHMRQNPAIRDALATLERWGVGIVASQSAEGEEKLASPEEIAAAVLHALARSPYRGRSVVVIGGAAREPVDRVRALSNESSGATAVALAQHAYFRGGTVELWLGHHSVPVPSYLPSRGWRSVDDLLRLAADQRGLLASAALVIVPAALADYTVVARPGKISSRDHPALTLRLRRAEKVLPRLREFAPPPVRLVGFKLEAETTPEALEASARRLAGEAGLDWVVADDAATMGSPEIHALVLPPRGGRHWLHGSKFDVAGKLLDDIGLDIAQQRTPRPGASGPAPRRRTAATRPRRRR